MSSNQGFSENQGILIGILYGLHPVLVFSPALNLGYYNEPFAVGVEISDSDKLEFWSKQKKNGWDPRVLDDELSSENYSLAKTCTL